ncbi:MAG: hypothetical protein AAFQ64_00110 [Pseudomonadota bacterium]
MKRVISLVSVVFCSGVPVGAFAQHTFGDTTFGGGVTLFGPMLEGSYTFEPNLRLRGMLIGGWDFDTTEVDEDGNMFDVDVDPAAAAILIDHSPRGDGLRFSGGLLFDLSEISAIGRGAGPDGFEVNGETFDEGVVTADAGLSSRVAPMIAAGYEYSLDDQWVLSGELGAIYAGGLSTTLTANSDLLQDTIDDDEDIQESLSDAASLTILPFISVAVSFRF